MLTHLTVGNNFNQPVDKLPPKLVHLTTSDSFNQPVDKLPPTLTLLITGCRFNQLVDLPQTLIHIRNTKFEELTFHLSLEVCFAVEKLVGTEKKVN